MTIDNLATHPKRFVTPKEYAEYLGLHWRTIYGYVARGQLRAIRVGSVIKIPIEEARRFASHPAAHAS